MSDIKIYVRFEKPKTVREFIRKFFPEGRAVATFRDKDCKKIQCSSGRSRSLYDLYYCVKTYFPAVKLRTVAAEVLALRPLNRKFSTWYCCTVNRSVMAWQNMYGMGVGFPAKGTSEYNWGKVMRELGIKNRKELDTFTVK